MNTAFLPVLLVAFAVVAYFLGRNRSVVVADGQLRSLHSLPSYYGVYAAIWCVAPAILLATLWLSIESTLITHYIVSNLPAAMVNGADVHVDLIVNDIVNIANGGITGSEPTQEIQQAADDYNALLNMSHIGLVVVTTALSGLLGWLALTRINANHRARNAVETVIQFSLMVCAGIAIVTTIGIVFSVIFESIQFFEKIPVTDFVFGLEWSPQTSIREDQVGSSGAFGAIPLFVGTLLISFIAMIIAAPVGLMSAIYLSEYASPKVRAIAKPAIEILAGIPTVVYGFFAALTVAPFLVDMGFSVGLDVSSESALAAGLVMGIMIIPFVSSLSDDVINAVPQSMRDGAYGLGATQSETIRRVIIPAALPGIVGGLLLAVSRAIGETMIVVMAAGLSANLTANPLEAVTTVTVQIVTLLTGDQEFDSAKTLAAFALGLMLFVVTLILNVIALHVVRKYREQYE